MPTFNCHAKGPARWAYCTMSNWAAPFHKTDNNHMTQHLTHAYIPAASAMVLEPEMQLDRDPCLSRAFTDELRVWLPF